MSQNQTLPINIDLPDGFLDEEIRCDYKISSCQKKIWAIQLDMYNLISRICEKYDIKFCVYWGTLLGAIRHNGFIPWDDDFDICMDRNNYEKFVSIPQEEFGEPYFLQTALTDRKFFLPMARLRNSLTTGAIAGMLSKDYNNGIYIDIYPMDGMLDNKLARTVQLFLLHLAIQPVSSYYMEKFPKGINGLAKRIIKLFSHLMPYKFWHGLFDMILKCPTKWCTKLAYICLFTQTAMRAYILKEEIGNLNEVQFEFGKVIAPCAAGKILSRIYGDYMKFPPVEKRGIWHAGKLILDPDTPYKEYFFNHGITE